MKIVSKYYVEITETTRKAADNNKKISPIIKKIKTKLLKNTEPVFTSFSGNQILPYPIAEI